MTATSSFKALLALAAALECTTPNQRGALFRIVASFVPSGSIDDCFLIGPLRSLFADYWESKLGQPVPIRGLRASLQSPVPLRTSELFNELELATDRHALAVAIAAIVAHLAERIGASDSISRHGRESIQREIMSGFGQVSLKRSKK
jgi:hypothetical protein